MPYHSLEACLLDLEKHGQLVRVKEEVDPYLQLASVHLRMYEKQGPAVLYENVKGCRWRTVSNIFGTVGRSRFIFRHNFQKIQQVIRMKDDPFSLLKQPLKNAAALFSAINGLPLKNPVSRPVLNSRLSIADLPHIHHWPEDGGAFITLPQVFTESISKPGIMHSNLGMYRIQLSGNAYSPNKEIGLHYQLHRGIGIHQQEAYHEGKPLKVSIFIGGPPAHSVAAVMPLPEGISELTFAGILGGRRFRYVYEDGFCISTDADFVITGEVYPGEVKQEGPFGDHLGYYSLAHDFPVMRVHKVYSRKNAIWPFTVVGRPPQEDTSFGNLIHEFTGQALQNEIPGLKEVHAVDAAGVHPLLLAIGSERYTPFSVTKQPAELLTIANHILGTGQLSLAKYLWITADDSNQLTVNNIPQFLSFVLQRLNTERDIHFYTQTTIDTLDYSGTGLNTGSKVVIAAYGEVVRTLCTEIPGAYSTINTFIRPAIALPGIIVLQAPPFINYEKASEEIKQLNKQLESSIEVLQTAPLLIITDDAAMTANSLKNLLWVTFTRSDPARDIHGIGSFISNKHWGCTGPLIIDARIKPHHAPPLEKDPATEEKTDRLFEKGGSLYAFR